METTKIRYDFKMLLEDELVFRAYLVDETTYYLLEVPEYGIDESYKELFIDIIKGDFELEYYATNDIKNNRLPDAPIKKELLATDALSRLEEARHLLKTLFGLSVQYEEASLEDMIAFRYDGHDLNIAYGLNPKNAGSLFSISNDLIGVVAANNTNFGEVLQMKEKVGSTIVPFKSERVDTDALNVIKKAIKDLNDNAIDSFFAQTNSLYKMFLKKLQMLTKLKELDTFEIIINGIPYGIDDLKSIRDIESQLYKDKVSGRAKIHHISKYLKNSPNIYSVSVLINGKSKTFHFNNQDGNFDHMIRIVKDNDEKEVDYEGFQKSEEVYYITSISQVPTL